MRILVWKELNATQRGAALQRPAQRDAYAVAQVTQTIIDAVRRDGDRALFEFTEKYDDVRLTQLAVSEAEFAAAERALTPAQHAAIETAIGTVHAFHSVQGAPPLRVETAPGVVCERLSVPVRAVGLYVPAGSAPLPSTAIMLAVPAAIANCPVRILCTAPGRSGAADPAVLVAARKAGVERIFKVGGAQAIAAMAYGTASIPKCDKLYGPGNAWVTAAKLLVANDAAGAAADLPAGVTEVLVIADDTARADFVAADLLAQAEHSTEAQALLVTTSAPLAQAVADQITLQARALARADILRESIGNIRMFIVDSLTEAFDVANEYAPEHLLLEVRDARRWLAHVSAAGSVFLGSWSPESMGDYCSGPNHTLPTYGHARAYSGLALEDFQKRITVQELSPAGLQALGPTARVLAGLEGLDAHAAAVTIRLDALAGAPASAGRADPLRSLARPDILDLHPYAHAVWLPTLTRLHANEAPWRPAGDTTEAGNNRYPEPQPRALVERLAQVYAVPTDSVLATHGSDEAIDLLSRIFLRAGSDAIVQCTPGFGMYQVAARIQGAAVLDVPLRRAAGWALEPEQVLAAWRPGVKLVYLCSPNNPTGNLLDEAGLDWLCTRLDGKAVVVIDEAYVEWSGRPSVTPWLARFPTLAILRTLSKAHALAGARIGALLANPALIELAKRIAPPYSLAQSTIEAAVHALQPAQLSASRACIDALLAEREYCRARMRTSPLVEHVWPSDANFFLADCSDAERFMQHSVEAGLIVRDLRGNPALPRSLRISVGTRAQNDALLASVGAT